MRAFFARLRPVTAAAGLSLAALSQPAQAIVSTSASSNWLATDDSFDGVARLVINGSTGCSGSLLAGGAYVLTAAHCVTTSSGALNVSSISLSFDSGSVTARVSSSSQVSVYSGWNGTLGANNDLALLRLDSAVTAIAGYDVWADSAIGETVVLAGYGYSGTGSTGYVTSTSLSTLHWGENVYDATYSAAGTAMYDFDNGSVRQNVIGALGLGSLEATIAPGDSGGPSFLALADGTLLLVGVHSFGERLANGRYDIDGTLNSSYGELAGDTTLSSAATRAWLSSVAQVSAVPEPASAWLMAAGSALFGLRHRLRRPAAG